MLAALCVLTFVRHASMYCLVLSISCVSRKRRREGVVSKGVVEKDVVTVLGEISVPTSSSASEGGSSNDFEESEEEEAAETVESEGGEEEEDEEESSGQEREVDSKN